MAEKFLTLMADLDDDSQACRHRDSLTISVLRHFLLIKSRRLLC